MTTLADSIVPEPFADRVEILLDELEFALQFDRPSILLVIYRSELVRADVEAALAEKLHPLGQRIEQLFINEGNHDLPVALRERADQTATVYCVSGMRFGGGEDGRNAYRALNIRREYFVEDHLRVIFWLTESEAKALPRYAPDFWAFRHRTVEFMDQPKSRHIRQHSHEMIWREWGSTESSDSRTFTEDTAAKIAYREQLLSELPDEPERIGARANLLYTLGPLYAAQGGYEKAIGVYQQAIALDPKNANPHNGLGIVYRGLGRTEEAIAAYQQAIALDPKNAVPHLSLASIYRKVGDVAAYKQQVEVGRLLIANEDVYNRACFASILGDVDEAIRLLEEHLATVPSMREWARRDLDFEFIRDDPRFQALVSEST